MAQPKTQTDPTPPAPAPAVEATPQQPTIGPIEYEVLGAPDRNGDRAYVRHHAREGLIMDGTVYLLGPVPAEWQSAPDQNGQTQTIRGTSTGLVPVPDARPIAEAAR